jgi:Pro-kumamolisin, activation domain
MRRVLNTRFSLILIVCAALLFTIKPVHAQQRQALLTHATAPSGAQPIGKLPASQQLELAISLPLRNQEQLNTLMQQLEDPNNPNYHHYLTSAQFIEQFGPTVEQYQQVIAFAQSHGLTVTHTSASRQLLNVTGSVADIEKTFQVTMQVYQHPTENRTYFAPNVTPTVDSGLPILGVSGLTTFARPHSMLKHAPAGVHSNQTGSGPGGQFLGSDFRAAYYGTGPMTGTGQALALIEFGQWNIADVQAYFTSVGQTNNVPIILELTGGTSGACPGACDDGEEANDVIQILSMAPGANVLIVYEDTSNNADINMFDAYATDNIAKQISMSFGIGNGNAAADEQQFLKMHAQGQNFFLASGDEGANLGGGGWPGYSQYVTDVGGTDLSTASAGGAWASETGWVGSGTGWCDPTNSNSPCFGVSNAGIPSYQSAISATIAAAGGTTKYRNVPDVSADANTDSFWCAAGTCQSGLGGTSLAAPRWAGFLALANEQAAANGETIGFLNPLVYTIGQGANYDTAFHDIISGSNPSGTTVPTEFVGSFTAMTGFDMVTGWGTPNGQGMINALAPTSTTNAFFTLAASPSTLNLTPGGTPGTATISLTPGNGFTGSVTLSATILGTPAGVTVSFNPTSISGSQTSILTVSTTSASPAGTQMIAVTGTSSGGIETQPAFVTLALPDFSLSVTPTTAFPNQPSTIYLNQGSTATATVTVDSQNNFTGSVNLSASALPKGVTGLFNPTSTSSTSTMTLTASSTATTVSGDYLTVSGTSGSISPLNAPYTILSVSAATGTGGSGTPVDLSSSYNLPAIYADGITFGTGLDGDGFGYSSNLLTTNRILNGVQFNFGSANTSNCGGNGQAACANDAVSTAGQTITLPANQQSTYTTLQLLATAFNGPILSQTIKVTYTDSTTSTFTQNFSDWCSCSPSKPGPGQQPGESFAVVMPYRDEATGAQDNRPFNLYAYTFVLNNAKTVQSVTLPAKPTSGGVVVFAATFTAQSLGTQINLASEYNTAGLYNNGVTFPANGGMDGGGDGCNAGSCADAYSAQQLGLTSTSSPTLTNNGVVFNLGPVNTANCTTACIVDMVNLNPGVTVTLPSNQQANYTTLTLLGTGVQGSHTATVTVTYTSGSPSVFNQTFSDWCNYQNASGNETVVVGGMSRINSDGTLNTQAQCNLYSYNYNLDSTRTLQSISLANTDGTNFSLVLAATLSGNTSGGTPGYTLSASPSSVSVAQGGNNTSTITVTPSGGFTGSVSLAASGLPTGVTASFNPTSTTTTSTLTLTASNSAAAGQSTVTITGTSGNLTETTTLSLTVTSTAPTSFSLSAGASSPATVSPGSSSQASVTVTPVNGFTGTVTLSCSIAPVVTGADAPTCSFGSTSPVSINNSSPANATLTFTTAGPSAASATARSPFYALLLPIPGLALVGLGFGSRGSRKKRFLGLLSFWVVLASLIVMPACGSSSNKGGGGGNSGTPAGNYTITINGAGGTETGNPPTVQITVN